MTLDRTRHQLLTAMGLGAVLASFSTGCESEPMVLFDGESWDRTSSGEPLAPPEEMVLSMGVVLADGVVQVAVTGGPAEGKVWVAWSRDLGTFCPEVMLGECMSIDAAKLVGSVMMDEAGEGHAELDAPADLRAGELVYIQAATRADGLIYLSQVELVEVADQRACEDVPLLTPDVDAGKLQHDDFFLVCAPTEEDGCEAAGHLNPWAELDMISDTCGENLSFGLMADADCLEEAVLDQCCYTVRIHDPNAPVDGGGGGGYSSWYYGRPFAVGAQWRGGAPSARADWRAQLDALDFSCLTPRSRIRLLKLWTEDAIEEHASVAAFARLALELLGLGAPPDLIAATIRAQADEVEHARFAFALASSLGERDLGAGPLDIGGALAQSNDARAVMLRNLLDGCINETICAMQVRVAAEGCTDPSLREQMRIVAADEGRHSELSWRILRWMLVTRPELREDARRAFASFVLPTVPDADPMAAELRRFGQLDGRQQALIAHQVWQQVIVPCADAALAQSVVEATA